MITQTEITGMTSETTSLQSKLDQIQTKINTHINTISQTLKGIGVETGSSPTPSSLATAMKGISVQEKMLSYVFDEVEHEVITPDPTGFTRSDRYFMTCGNGTLLMSTGNSYWKANDVHHAWDKLTVPFDANHIIRYAGGYFFAFKKASASTTYYTSVTGLNWTSRTIASGYWNTIAYHNKQFVISSYDENVADVATYTPTQTNSYMSTSGLDNWVLCKAGTTAISLISVEWIDNANAFVGLTEDRKVYVLPEGKSTTDWYLAGGTTLPRVYNTIVDLGGQGAAFTSVRWDGSHWTNTTSYGADDGEICIRPDGYSSLGEKRLKPRSEINHIRSILHVNGLLVLIGRSTAGKDYLLWASKPISGNFFSKEVGMSSYADNYGKYTNLMLYKGYLLWAIQGMTPGTSVVFYTKWNQIAGDGSVSNHRCYVDGYLEKPDDPIHILGHILGVPRRGNFIPKIFAYGNGVYLGVDGDNRIPKGIVGRYDVMQGEPQYVRSTDGVHWERKDLFSSSSDMSTWKTENGIVFGNGWFVVPVVNAVRTGTPSAAFKYRMMRSKDGLTWEYTEFQNRGTSEHTTSLAYGNGIFLMITRGIPGTLAYYSTNGIDWHAGEHNIPSTYVNQESLGAYFVNGYFIARNLGSNFYYSKDGIFWTLATTFASRVPVTMCYGNNQWIASPDNKAGILMRSDNMDDWTPIDFSGTDLASSTWSNVCFGEGMFIASTNVAGSNRNKIAISYDGYNWKLMPNGFCSATSKEAPIQYVGTTFLAEGNDYTVLRYDFLGKKRNGMLTKANQMDTDLRIVNSYKISASSPNNFQCVTYGSGIFVSPSYASSTIYNKTNPGKWVSNSSLGSTQNWKCACYGNGVYLIFSYTSTTSYGYSRDGTTWTAKTLPSARSVYGCTYAKGQFVLASVGTNSCLTSPDGVTWTQRTMPSSYNWCSVAYGNGVYVMACDAASYVATSPDGITWTNRSIPFSFAGTVRIAFGNGVFVIISSATHKSLVSSDGINWSQNYIYPESASVRNLSGFCFGDGYFLALDASNPSRIHYTSKDGCHWTPHPIAKTSDSGYLDIMDCCYGGGKFIGVGSSGFAQEFKVVERPMVNNSERPHICSGQVSFATSTVSRSIYFNFKPEYVLLVQQGVHASNSSIFIEIPRGEPGVHITTGGVYANTTNTDIVGNCVTILGNDRYYGGSAPACTYTYYAF